MWLPVLNADFMDALSEFLNAAESAAPDALARYFRKPAFYLVVLQVSNANKFVAERL